MRFPPFYHSMVQTRVWDAADESGRITVEVSEGFVDSLDGHERYTKLKNHALFNFQPAPLRESMSLEMNQRKANHKQVFYRVRESHGPTRECSNAPFPLDTYQCRSTVWEVYQISCLKLSRTGIMATRRLIRGT